MKFRFGNVCGVFPIKDKDFDIVHCVIERDGAFETCSSVSQKGQYNVDDEVVIVGYKDPIIIKSSIFKERS